MAFSLDPALETGFTAVVERLLGALDEGMDKTSGSVARTLVEAYAREMVVFYGMLDRAHKAGYLDTAEGAALDNVVAMLGVARARAGRLAGQIELSRASPAPQDIDIVAGRRVTGPPDAKGNELPVFEIVEDAVLRRGELRVTVRVQQVDDDSVPADKVPQVIDSGSLTVIPRPLLGIELVTNPAPITRAGKDETDAELRARGRSALHDAGKGTLGAIAAVVREQGVRDVAVREPADGQVGVVEIVIGDPDVAGDPERVRQIEAAVRAAKPAGIRLDVSYAQRVFLEASFAVETADPDLDNTGFARLSASLTQALTDFTAALSAGTTVSRRKMEAALFADAAVQRLTEIKVSTYVYVSDPKTPHAPPTLVKESASRTTGAERDWRMGPLETAVIDLAVKPPQIERFMPPIYRVDVVVTVVTSPTTGRPTEAEVREALSLALDTFTTQLFDAEKTKLKLSELAPVLVGHAALKDVGAVDVTRVDTGMSYDLANQDVDLATGYRLVLGSVEIVRTAS